MEEQVNIIPKPEYFVKPVFIALKELGGAASKHEVIKRILENENISHQLLQVEIIVRGRPQGELTRNIGFACTCLKENGIVTYPKLGYWSLTELGRATNQINRTHSTGSFTSTTGKHRRKINRACKDFNKGRIVTTGIGCYARSGWLGHIERDIKTNYSI